MKKNNLPFISYWLIFLIMVIASCYKKEYRKTSLTSKDTVCPCKLSGLWIGQFTTGIGYQNPKGTKYELSFTLYPDQFFIYKSGTSTPKLSAYGKGQWSIDGTTFKMRSEVINNSLIGQDSVFCTATFDTASCSLLNGTCLTMPANAKCTFSLTKVK